MNKKGEKMINKMEIDKGFNYYNINPKYKNRCYACAEAINKNIDCLNSFNKIFNLLNYENFNDIKTYWNIKNIDEMFCKNIDSFVTNLLIVLSYKTHESNIKRNKLNYDQILIHKKRVKECFENDLEKRKYDNIRISQMLWAIYFIRVRLIEVGRLQYEYFEDEGKCFIKIHIPSGEKLDYDKVIDSIDKSEEELKKVYHIKDINYVCQSWLLSNQLNAIIEPNTNIYKFYRLFYVEDGEDCTFDILNFVFSLNECENYNDLPENTILQKIIKQQLINGEKFKLGIGILSKKE